MKTSFLHERDSRHHLLERAGGWSATGLMAVLMAFAVPGQATAQQGQSESSITYASEVAEIVNQNCVRCHRDGGIAPMSLQSYQQVRGYAPLIRERVVNEEMPPYAYDRDQGIQDLQHDWRLSEEQIDTIATWVDNGAPMGDESAVPEPPQFEPGVPWNFTEQFGEPDLVVKSPPIDVPAGGNDMWFEPNVASGLDQDRCIQAVQVRPADGQAASVVHHANSRFTLPSEEGSELESAGRLTEYAMGKVGEIIPEGVCRTAPADSYVSWSIHLYPGGIGDTAPGETIEDNVVELGIWLHPEDYEAEYEQDLASYGVDQGEMVVPPHGTTMQQDFHSFDHPVRIDSFQPHAHLRGVAASLQIYYPSTGEMETVSMISDWSAKWHHSHIYAQDKAPLVPAGAVVVLKQWYDNRASNPNNPDPDQWVDWGQRTADEMDHAWIAITHLDEEGYQELTAQREQQDEAEQSVASVD